MAVSIPPKVFLKRQRCRRICANKDNSILPYPILLCTLNARYHHSSFGLRYLYANLRELQPLAKIVEFTISQNPRDIAEKILSESPTVVGFGIYIWNTETTQQVVSILKKVRPDLTVVLGGPEVSYEAENQQICQISDYVIQGEAEVEFYSLCKKLLSDETIGQKKVDQKILRGSLPEIQNITLPYDYYTDDDIKNRIIYVEASRGCPYRCEYCLSSLDKSVRSFDLDLFLNEIEKLIQRGARSFKFVDRTFNLSITSSSRILKFFLERMNLGLFLHFEMVPDRLPIELQELIRQFPAGALQFEIGIQTWSPAVAQLVSRRQNYEKIRENFNFLNEQTGVHLHTDLIAGLPGETWESFAHGFDQVASLGTQEIQVGILKRLKGTPIIRHDQEWGMVYQDHPPFQILQTKTLSFDQLQKLGRFSQFWDSVANSGNFTNTMNFFRERCRTSGRSFFSDFFQLSEFLSQRHPTGHSVALLNLVESIWIYLTQESQVSPDQARSLLIADYAGKVKRDIPKFLRASNESSKVSSPESPALPGLFVSPGLPKRQAKHQLQTQK